jgi:Zn-dependent M16 (insulinase) family peptidase
MKMCIGMSTNMRCSWIQDTMQGISVQVLLEIEMDDESSYLMQKIVKVNEGYIYVNVLLEDEETRRKKW